MSKLATMPELEGVSHRFLEVGGTRLHVAEAGAGAPLLMLHGWPQHWWVWRRVLPYLAAGRRVICPDLRGFGWSDAPAGNYELAELAADIDNLLDVLELGPVELIGHDWGGYLGFLLCLAAPERFRHFLALGVTHPWIEPPPPSPRVLRTFSYQFLLAAPALGVAVLRHAPAFVRTVLRRGSDPESSWSEAELDCFAQSFRAADHARAASQLYRSFLRRELPRLRRGEYRSQRLAVPTRLLAGAADPVIRPALLEGYQPYAEQMSVEVIEGSGHFLAEERPDVVLARAGELFGPPGGG